MSSTDVHPLLATATQLHASGQIDQAERLYHQVLAISPGSSDAVHLLGIVACQRGQFDRGLELISRAIFTSPNVSGYHNSLGNALRGLGRLDDAVRAYRRACELDANNLEALNNLAVALDDCDATTESLACFDRLISARNDIPQWHTNRGSAQMSANQLQAAIESFRRAIALRPDFAVAHAKLSAALLRIGNFAEGWIEAEWRFLARSIIDPGGASPRWDGSSLAGRTLLIHAEQGLGDSIQFIRYAKLIDKQGGRVILRCQPALQRLLASVQGVDEVCRMDQPLPKHDVQIAMLSLPLLFATVMETIPNQVPYIVPPTELVTQWAGRLASTANQKKRVGIAWAGNPNHANDRRRSCPPRELAALEGLPGIELHRLQMPRELPSPPELSLVDHTEHLTDLADSAGLIANLDLVISVDTAIAHLAGAMGKPVSILLPYSSEWRWLEEREDSPWYPTARLFRQSAPGDWQGALNRVREVLKLKTTRRT